MSRKDKKKELQAALHTEALHYKDVMDEGMRGKSTTDGLQFLVNHIHFQIKGEPQRKGFFLAAVSEFRHMTGVHISV